MPSFSSILLSKELATRNRCSASVIGASCAPRKKLEQQRKADKSAEYAARWNDSVMFHSRKILRKITSLNNPQDVIRWLETDDEFGKKEDKENCARHILNFLEEFAAAIHEDYCDEEYLKRLFRGIVINIWSAMRDWAMQERRKKHRPTIFIETETLYNSWKN